MQRADPTEHAVESVQHVDAHLDTRGQAADPGSRRRDGQRPRLRRHSRCAARDRQLDRVASFASKRDPAQRHHHRPRLESGGYLWQRLPALFAFRALDFARRRGLPHRPLLDCQCATRGGLDTGSRRDDVHPVRAKSVRLTGCHSSRSSAPRVKVTGDRPRRAEFKSANHLRMAPGAVQVIPIAGGPAPGDNQDAPHRITPARSPPSPGCGRSRSRPDAVRPRRPLHRFALYSRATGGFGLREWYKHWGSVMNGDPTEHV